jgi:hypothetical protein
VGRDRPVVFDELMAAPLVLRHKDVSAALRRRRIQNRFFSPAAGARYAARVLPVARRGFVQHGTEALHVLLS